MPPFNLLKLIIAIAIAALVALVCVDWLGPTLVATGAPFLKEFGSFIAGPAGYIIGLLFGVWFYARGSIGGVV